MDMPLINNEIWNSDITAEMISKDALRFTFVDIGPNGIFFDEGRASEKGRVAIVKQNFNLHDDKEDIIPLEYNARTKAHEYGGKSFFLQNDSDENLLYFINYSDQAIYQIDKNKKITKVFGEKNCRYADLVIIKKGDKRHLICVEENHQGKEVINRIIKIDLNEKSKDVIASGHDFYSSLSLSPDNTKIAYITWDHPNMPWDGSDLFVLNLSEEILNPIHIAGGNDESISQPRYAPDGKLFFLSDRTGFSNIYYFDEGQEINPVYTLDGDFNYPDWLFGFSNYAFVEKGGSYVIYASYDKKAASHLVEIDPNDSNVKQIDLPFTYFSSIKSYKNKLVFIAGSGKLEKSVFVLDTISKNYDLIKSPRRIEINEDYISFPQKIEFTNSEGEKVYAFYYPPKNPKIENYPNKTTIPLIVKSHGGPTGHSLPVLDLTVQYFTSRGFAFVDVNYSGSSGYGRKYRNRLRGKWGILDVSDCVHAAKYLIEKKAVDAKKIAIKGGSAGGYTTLAALTFTDFFKLGVSYYGVADLEDLTKFTHKFESHYLDRLVGLYPEDKQTYYDRSPIHFTKNLSCPIILFQGGEDKVVPQEQADMMYKALMKKKLPTAYVLFPEEGHGFRSSENIKTSLENELYFYSKIYNLRLNEKIKTIKIDNL